MATTSIWRVHGRLKTVVDYAENIEKTANPKASRETDGGLNEVLHYAMDGRKTTEVHDEREALISQFVSGINCSPQTAVQEMLAVKKRFGKEDGTIAYHGYQSFAEGEVTPELAHEIGVKLAERLWGERYQVVVTTHLDKKNHLHNHLVLNTVSHIDGIKYHRTEQDYHRMREESDKLCREYQLSVVENPGGKSKNYAEWMAEKSGVPTKRDMIRADIDRAILASTTEEHFVRVMTEMGYEFKTKGENGQRLKRPGLKPYGAKGYFRFQNLGDGYSSEEILARIYDNVRRKDPFPETRENPRALYNYDSTTPVKKLKGIYALYIRYCFELHIIQRHPTSQKRVHFLLREDLLKLDKLDAQTRFLGANKIETIEQLDSYRASAKEQITVLTAERSDLRNRLKRERRKGDGQAVRETEAKIEAISAELKKLRKEVAICDEVAERSAQIRENLEQLEQDQNIEEKEENNDELFRRSGRSSR